MGINNRVVDGWKSLLSVVRFDHREWCESATKSSLPGWVFLAGALGLFVELMLIRWHSSRLTLFANYKNLSLLSCFLGLGLGYAINRRKAIRLYSIFIGLFAQFLLFRFADKLNLQWQLGNISEDMSLGLRNSNSLFQWALTIAFIAVMFVLNAWTNIPLGQIAGTLMARMDKLHAYGWNLAGSLFGILAFMFLSYVWSPVGVWFAVAFMLLFPFLARPSRVAAVSAVSAFALIIMIGWQPNGPTRFLYSPYQFVGVTPNAHEAAIMQVDVNHVYHQNILDLSREKQNQYQAVQGLAQHYEMAYTYKINPDDVLIVGAGTGNDVAAAIRKGAQRIDAVEIDPLILSLGMQFHPEAPYQNPKVHRHQTDARSFIRETQRRYDLIVYGLLDSHTLLSSMTNVRLDSFVYTVDAFRESRKKLKADGVLSVTFCVLNDLMARKLFLMLQQAFDGQIPLVWSTGYDGGLMFLTGPGVKGTTPLPAAPENKTAYFASATTSPDVSTDDWPFFYMPTRNYPISYVVVLMLIALLSFGFVKTLLPASETKSPEKRWWFFFFLGAAFMLVETRAITELALVFGNTWQVVAVVIAGILTMAFVGNFFILRKGEISPTLTFLGLTGALVVGWYFNLSHRESLTGPMEKLLIVGVTSAPVLFAGLLFSSGLKRANNISSVLSANLFGSICGGLLEYNSMYFGFRSLYLMSMALYLFAYVSLFRPSEVLIFSGRQKLKN